MNIQGLNHLCFSVSDLERSIAFYRDVFSAKLLVRGRKLAYFDLAGLWVALNVEEVDRSRAGRSYTHVAFTVAERDFDAFAARLGTLGVETLPGRERDERDRRSVYFLDPDGHRFEFHTGALHDRLAYYRDEKKHMLFFAEQDPPQPAPKDALRIEALRALEGRDAEQLCRLLIDVVEDGASIGFLPPLAEADAERYWSGVVGDDVVLWVARLDDRIVGTVQLQLCMKPNGMHRAEIAKLMVSPQARRRGVARRLMEAAESRARAEGRSLLVLDTREGDPSNRLYASLDYIQAGRIPNFARSATGSLDATILYYKPLDLDVT